MLKFRYQSLKINKYLKIYISNTNVFCSEMKELTTCANIGLFCEFAPVLRSIETKYSLIMFSTSFCG